MADPTNRGPVRWAVIGLGWFGEIHADTLDGINSTTFSQTSHLHSSSYVDVTGDIMSGNLGIAQGSATATLNITQTGTTAETALIRMTNSGNAEDAREGAKVGVEEALWQRGGGGAF